MIQDNTPLEKYKIDGRTIYVKREDLCTQLPGPPFSKCRGLYPHMKRLRDEKGITTVGYVETPISMAGWGVAWCGANLGIKTVIYEPQYKNGPPEMLTKHKQHWMEFDVVLESVPAGRTCVNQHFAKKHLLKKYGSSAHLLPIGIPSQETVNETALEWRRTINKYGKFENVIVPIGSGTICAGLLKGMLPNEGMLTGVLACSKNIPKKFKAICNKADKQNNPLFGNNLNFRFIDPGWEYTEMASAQPPFPCHRYYDAKAWQWLIENLNNLKGRVLFWNIGRESD
jgi:1-aminocyclopropane-1-carboxylate deaminase/D-cysteine desulfhydrase-like pyridoxal-dependent ACC family enzyme